MQLLRFLPGLFGFRVFRPLARALFFQPAVWEDFSAELRTKVQSRSTTTLRLE